MIIELLCKFILSFNFIANMNPIELPAWIENSVYTAFNYLSFISPVVDLSLLLIAITMIFTVFIFSILIKFILGFFHK